jgi:hypothetical protein
MSSTIVTLAPKDLLAAWRLQRRKSFAVQLSRYVPIPLAAIYLWGSWQDLADFGWRALLEDPALPMITFFLVTLNVLAETVTLPRRAKRIMAQQKGLSGEIAVTWDEATIEVRNANGHGRLAWGDYSRWLEDDTMLVLFQSDNVLNLLPKRFLSDEQVSDIRNRLTAALGKVGKKKRVS